MKRNDEFQNCDNGCFLKKFDLFLKNNLNNCKGHWFARVIKTR